MTWIHTYSGIAWDLAMSRAENVRLNDIAHALARIARFTGHTRTTGIYSVAQHSLAVMRRARDLRAPPAVVLGALLHDAHETYLGDVSSPLASLLPGLDALKVSHDCAIAEWAGIAPDNLWSPIVLRADAEALATERRDLLGPSPRPWSELPPPWAEPTSIGSEIRRVERTFVALARAMLPEGTP